MSNRTDFLKELLQEHPELHTYYDSGQYKISLKIIEYMIANCLTERQISEKLGLDLNYTNRLMSGDNTIEIFVYQQVINQLSIER